MPPDKAGNQSTGRNGVR